MNSEARSVSKHLAVLLRATGLLSLIVATTSFLGACKSGGGVGEHDATPPFDGSVQPDTNLSDATPPDAQPPVDAEVLPDSSSPDSTVGPDGSTEPDLDQDGYPASHDCDDMDSSIYPGVTRTCSSPCDTGVEVCLADGTWTQCSATTDCQCTTPGQTRVVPCGNCGQKSQICSSSLTWVDQSSCINQGVCSPGQQDQVTCAYCGSGIRLCQNDCQWGPADCTGVCVSGATETTNSVCPNPWEYQQQTCNTQCQWSITQACTTQCLFAPRTGTPDYKDEVCVPGGPFVMGRPVGAGTYPDEEPAHTVNLSPFFMDLYEVTNARYRECVTAGVCAMPNIGASYFQSGTDIRPVDGVSHAMASTFCAWDGGRLVPTEAQWEKAARGPSPRTVLNPWGDTPGTCTLSGGDECHPIGEYHAYDVGTHPLGVSYYGIHDLAGNIKEWTADWYASDYYPTSPSFDPTGPAFGTYRSTRSLTFSTSLSYYGHTATFRSYHSPGNTTLGIGIRCVRRGY
ncbi:MAG: SUMF1/EgtB/PvdO family nonheme iron enzyme [Polyangia bacterium]|nr:SUMF1/EgtB/PvdO family nonheme iron enzyme [Polyangia bacterium]